LETYAFPTLGRKPVGSIGAPDISSPIAGVWTEKPETGWRVCQQICAAFELCSRAGMAFDCGARTIPRGGQSAAEAT